MRRLRASENPNRFCRGVPLWGVCVGVRGLVSSLRFCALDAPCSPEHTELAVKPAACRPSPDFSQMPYLEMQPSALDHSQGPGEAAAAFFSPSLSYSFFKCYLFFKHSLSLIHFSNVHYVPGSCSRYRGLQQRAKPVKLCLKEFTFWRRQK